MSLNRLYSMFGPKRKLGRDDIEKYGRTRNQRLKNEIEQHSVSSSFEQDALEGWGDLAYDTSVMTKLDQKFNAPKNLTWIWVMGTAVVCSITFILINTLFTPNTLYSPVINNGAKKYVTVQQIILEKSDLLISSEIEKMTVRPNQEQIQPLEIKNDYAYRNPELQNEIDLSIQPLVVLPIADKHTSHTLIVPHKHAKEIYLNDFKIVDYRLYRSKPTVKTKQLILTGTPASNEDKTMSNEEYIWKDVDAPYIDYINKSVRVFGKGNYKKALMRFETIIKTYPHDVNANFYGGLCLYNLGAFQQSITLFNQCLDGSYSNFDEEALWMKAMSLIDSGQEKKAKPIFKQIEHAEGFYSDQARTELLNLH
jgi:TolA-binding protein